MGFFTFSCVIFSLQFLFVVVGVGFLKVFLCLIFVCLLEKGYFNLTIINIGIDRAYRRVQNYLPFFFFLNVYPSFFSFFLSFVFHICLTSLKQCPVNLIASCTTQKHTDTHPLVVISSHPQIPLLFRLRCVCSLPFSFLPRSWKLLAYVAFSGNRRGSPFRGHKPLTSLHGYIRV